MNRNPMIAEWILKLFTTAEQASSITGDLEETRRNWLEFWWAVSRTAARFLWSDLVGGRRTLVGLAFRGSLLQFVYVLVANFLLFFAAMARVGEHGWELQLVVIATGFHAGRWVARRAQGKEIAAAFALNAFQYAIGVVVGIAMIIYGKTGVPWTDLIPLVSLRSLAMCLPAFAGAVFERNGMRFFRRAPLVKA